VFIILFTEVEVIPLNAPASTTTKVVVAEPMFDGGSIVTAPPEIVTLDEETPMVENAVPPALPDLNVILPVPLYTCWSKVMIILDARATLVAPILGLNTMGTGGTSSLVAVRTPTVIVSLRIFAVFAIPVRFAPLPTKEVAVMIPEVLMLPVLPIPTPVNPLPLPLKEVAVMIPEVLMLPVLPIPTPVNPLPLPLKEVAVMIPTLKFDGGEILVENPARLDALDILLLLFSYL
jgi:hypothetical protein